MKWPSLPTDSQRKLQNATWYGHHISRHLFLTTYTVQSWFSDIKFSDNLRFSDYLFFKDHFSIYYIKIIHLVTLSGCVTVFVETKSVTKSRVHCTYTNMVSSWWSGGANLKKSMCGQMFSQDNGHLILTKEHTREWVCVFTRACIRATPQYSIRRKTLLN